MTNRKKKEVLRNDPSDDLFPPPTTFSSSFAAGEIGRNLTNNKANCECVCVLKKEGPPFSSLLAQGTNTDTTCWVLRKQ